ncbi:hypothetical protein SAMN05216278_3340 [Halopelagius longus]|uniref:DUF4013 domain-containing protein n=2 Tax=Halopelagius longus TaxID=1236180 RepID=A0A1H1FPZ6_9EURY|nr:hypothetical protein SAMN05216278_3340 [Halopelagius longus]
MAFGRVLKRALTRLQRDPLLGLPFVIAGVVIALADAIRAWDPIPVTTPEWVGKALSVQYSFFPSGPARTVRTLSAVVDLRTPYALGAVTLEVAVFFVVGLAGWVTITRALDTDRHLGSLVRYLGVFGSTGVIPVLLGPTSVSLDSLPLTLLGLVIVSVVSVRFFLFSGFVGRGDRVAVALKRSVCASKGAFWPLLSLVVIFGVGYWVLAQVPLVGGFLSTGIVAPLHSVALAVLLEQRGDC